jgi:hypothetical protein
MPEKYSVLLYNLYDLDYLNACISDITEGVSELAEVKRLKEVAPKFRVQDRKQLEQAALDKFFEGFFDALNELELTPEELLKRYYFE